LADITLGSSFHPDTNEESGGIPLEEIPSRIVLE